MAQTFREFLVAALDDGADRAAVDEALDKAGGYIKAPTGEDIPNEAVLDAEADVILEGIKALRTAAPANIVTPKAPPVPPVVAAAPSPPPAAEPTLPAALQPIEPKADLPKDVEAKIAGLQTAPPPAPDLSFTDTLKTPLMRAAHVVGVLGGAGGAVGEEVAAQTMDTAGLKREDVVPSPMLRAKEETEAHIKEMLGKDGYEALVQDFQDNAVALLSLPGVVLGSQMPDELAKLPLGQAVAKAYVQGEKVGSGLVGGAVGGTVAMFGSWQAAKDAFDATPVTFALVVLPAIKGAMAAGRATPGLSRAVGVLDKVYPALTGAAGKRAEAATRGVRAVAKMGLNAEAPLVRRIATFVYGNAYAPELATRVANWLNDIGIGENAAAADIRQLIMFGPDELKRRIEAWGTQAAREIEAGRLSPETDLAVPETPPPGAVAVEAYKKAADVAAEKRTAAIEAAEAAEGAFVGEEAGKAAQAEATTQAAAAREAVRAAQKAEKAAKGKAAEATGEAEARRFKALSQAEIDQAAAALKKAKDDEQAAAALLDEAQIAVKKATGEARSVARMELNRARAAAEDARALRKEAEARVKITTQAQAGAERVARETGAAGDVAGVPEVAKVSAERAAAEKALADTEAAIADAKARREAAAGARGEARAVGKEATAAEVEARKAGWEAIGQEIRGEVTLRRTGQAEEAIPISRARAEASDKPFLPWVWSKRGRIPKEAATSADIAAGAYYIPERWFPPDDPRALVMDHPVVRDTLGAAGKAVEKILDTKDALITKAETPELQALREVWAKAPMTADEWANVVGAGLRDDANAFLNAPAIRRRAAKLAEKDGFDARTAEQTLEAMTGDTFAEKGVKYVKPNPKTKVPTDFRRYMLDAIAEEVKGDPKKLRALRAEVTERLFSRVAQKVADAEYARNVAQELYRISGKDITEYADNLVRQVIVEGEPLPEGIVGIPSGGRGLAGHIVDLAADRYVPMVAEGLGITPEEAAKRVAWLRRELMAGYVQPSAILKRHMAEQAAQIQPSWLPKDDAGAPRTDLGSMADFNAVRRTTNDNLTWELRARMGGDIAGAWNFLGNLAKANQTIYNPSSLVNNVQANLLELSARRGLSPFSIAKQAAQTGKAFIDYQKSGVEQAAQTRRGQLFRKFEEHGLVKTAYVQQDIGTFSSADRLGAPHRAMQKGYAWGDNIFKLDEALRTAEETLGDLDGFKPGHGREFDLGHGNVVWVERTADGWTATRTRVGGKPTKAGEGLGRENARKLSQDDLVDLVARSGEKAAYDLMFDYSRLANYQKFLKLLGPLGAHSPFFTWMWKALDVPFFKKGLAYRALMGPDLPRTNSPALLAKQAGRMMQLSARRAIMLNAAREELYRLNPPFLQQMFGFMPQGAKFGLLNVLTNPEVVGVRDFRASVPWVPTETLLRGTFGLIEPVFRSPEGELYPEGEAGEIDWNLVEQPDLTQEQKDAIRKARSIVAKQESGRVWAPTDVLELAGLAGGPLLDALTLAEEAARKGEDFPWYKIAAWAFGGGLVKGYDVARGLIDPESDASTRRRTRLYLGGQQGWSEPGYQWAIRRMTGLGFQRALVAGQAEWYLRGISKKLQANLAAEQSERLKVLALSYHDSRLTEEEKAEILEDAQAARAIYQRKMQIVAGTIRDMAAEFLKGRAILSGKAKEKAEAVPPPK